MVGFINLGLSIRMPASAGQEHSLVVKTDIMDKCVLIIRYGLFKCPKIIISSSHKKSAILYRIFFIPSIWGIPIFDRYAIKALILADIDQKYSGEAKTRQSASLILGINSLKASFWTQGFS